jgi:5-formyltetrahydrofolate cyclo-ligase
MYFFTYMSNKSLLRRRYLNILKSFSDQNLISKSKIIAEKMQSISIFFPQPIVIFWPKNIEPKLFQEKEIFNNWCNSVFPKTTHKILRFYHLTNPALLTFNQKFKIFEPSLYSYPISSHEIKTVILPVVAFDSRGYRIGYGKGFYDRFFQQNPSIIKIGVAFKEQKTYELIDNDALDQKLTYIITD